MTWKSPRIWLDGPHITSAQMNAVSDNLRETAPAKAQARGDVFVGIGLNQIKRLVIGSARQVFQVNDAGNDVLWGVLPTPIVSPGDLIVGNSMGESVRLARGAAGQELQPTNAGLTWGWPERHWMDLFPDKQWWPGSSDYDLSIPITDGGQSYTPQFTWARDISIGGDLLIESERPTVWVCRNITLSASTTITCRSPRVNNRYPLRSGADDNSGTLGCGDQGDIRSTSGAFLPPLPSTPPPDGTITDWSGATGIAFRNSIRGQGYHGGGGVTGTDKEGGGVFILIARQITYNDHSFAVNCDGQRGSFIRGTRAPSTGGGAIIIAASMGSFPTLSVTGGSSGSGSYISGVVFNNRGHWNKAGDGTTFTGRALPWA